MRATRTVAAWVRLYTRPNCGLCANAKYEIEQAAAKTPFELAEIDITKPEHQAAFDKYAFDVPVLHVAPTESGDPTKVFMHRVNAADLLAALKN